MPRAFIAVLFAAGAAACAPTFNWREVQVASTPLKALLPCKPDSASRDVPLMGKPVRLEVLGCDAGGATFALLQADIGDGANAGPALAQWRAASLATLRTATGRDTPFVPAGAARLPQSLSVVAAGRRADGTPVESQAAYFASGTRVYQAVVIAEKLRPDITEPFFAGLQLQ